MLSWNIFRRAVMLIVDNLGAALRVSALPYAAFIAVNLWFAGTVDMEAIATFDPEADPGALPALPEGSVTAVFLTLFVQTLAFVWIAVAWHRFVLLAEGGASWVPPLRGREMLGYLGRSILIVLILSAVGIATLLLVAPILPFVAIPLVVILSIILSYRLGLILPAGAIGRPLTLTQAWQATKGQSGTVVLLAILTYLAALLLQVPALIDAMGGADLSDPAAAVEALSAPGPVAMLYNFVISWILLMLGISVLSTLYGHFVEGRRLD